MLRSLSSSTGLSLFHSSATLKTSSRSRLTNDLKQKNPQKLKVASSKPRRTITSGGHINKNLHQPSPKREFARDPFPHQDPQRSTSRNDDRNPSFRRGRRNNSVGKWGLEGFHIKAPHDNFRKPYNSEFDKPWRKGQRDPQADNSFGDITRSVLSNEGKHKRGTLSASVKNFSERLQNSRRTMKSSFLEDHLTQQHPLHHKKSSSERSQNSPDAQQRHQGSSSIPERRQTPRETVISEFSEKNTTRPRSSELTTEFTSPPLLPTLLSGVKEVLGNNATPTPIQSLSLKWLLHDHELPKTNADWKQFLLASETGSGKSLAYLLPLLQDLKMSEIDPYSSPPQPSQRPLNPRALILAPTHELSRQLSGFAKAMLHQTKLRVQCASRANLKSTKEHDATSRQMFSQLDSDERAGEFDVRKSSRFPVDVLVGTPMKLLEMIRGRGWDRKEVVEEDIEEDDEKSGPKPRRGRDKMVGFGKWRSKPEIGLANVEWVVVDEADVLFDSDFQETTRQLLADISAARGHPVSLTPSPSFSHSSTEDTTVSTPIPYDYPFNFILTSATIPGSLSTYLDVHHPNMMRLASPRLHHLPKTIKTEYVAWSGGNKNADIEHQIRHVWAQDAASVGAEGSTQKLSKVLVFINKSSKVEELGSYLDEKGIKCVALSSTSEHRKRGSNHHLDGFLRERGDKELSTENDPLASDPKSDPHVLITTSLLSRGLDFSPSIQNVFIVDEPRNMIDFLHRAGRTGRAGEKGKVVIFGKMSGRGSSKAQEARKRVASLATP